ncbi:hypothetical protein L0337_31835 [candidate division KSB1 bacterium]|nr:hypothetical protein [candidate division KSB1 bacterium]
MSEWFWYIRKPDELLLDLDSPWRLHAAIAKLRRADKKLRIIKVWAYPSLSDGKWHVIVQYDPDENSYTQRQAILWAWWAGSDPIRALYSLTRCEYYLPAPDLLISPQKWQRFRREPDFICHCPAKHKGEDACARCPVFRKLHETHAGIAYYPLAEQPKIEPGVQEWPPKK